MGDFAAYLLYRASSAVVAALPLRLVFRLGEMAGLFAWLILPRYRGLALRNATVAFGGEKSARDLRHLIRQHFRLLGANLLSSVRIGTMPVEQIKQHVDIQNIEPMSAARRAGTPVVLLLTHLANWELFSQLMPGFYPGMKSASIYQRLSNRLMDAHMLKVRSRTGLLLFDRSEGFKSVIDMLRTGGAVGVLSDQHAGDHGVWTLFFGRLASTTPLGPLLAKRTQAALFAAAVYTEGVAKWRMVFTDEIDKQDQSVEGLTALANRVIEQQIRVAPQNWFWVHDRWKTPQPNFLLSRYKRGVYLPPVMSEEPPKPFRILIRSSNWLGDAVMSVPAVRAIKRGRPDAQVTILTSEALAPMWKLVTDADEILTANTTSLLSVARAIRRTADSFDTAILFPNSMRAALEVWLGGIRRRVGYRGHSRSWLLNQIVREPNKPRPPEHQIRKYLRIAHALGADVSDPSLAAPVSLVATQNRSGPGDGVERLGLCPGAEYGPAKRWLPERFAEAALAIAEQKPVNWFLFGKETDNAAGASIASALGDRCVNRIGKTTLEELIQELRLCRLLLTNDTGTMHLAALLGVPTVAVFGSTEPRLTGPLGTNHVILRHHVECSPCFLRECPIDFRCMKAVTVEEVVKAVRGLLRSP
ncbi:MAG TPA: lipopolysaccharide heptosyltransferase II [Chthoniobacterales bacterium]|nr:lipopolysaccharide heptosyltransferase II [Chthoniobacterales bacterium]